MQQWRGHTVLLLLVALGLLSAAASGVSPSARISTPVGGREIFWDPNTQQTLWVGQTLSLKFVACDVLGCTKPEDVQRTLHGILQPTAGVEETPVPREGPTGESAHAADLPVCNDYCACTGCTATTGAASVITVVASDSLVQLSTGSRASAQSVPQHGQQQQQPGPRGAEDRSRQPPSAGVFGATSITVIPGAGGGTGQVKATSNTAVSTTIGATGSQLNGVDVPVTWKAANWALSLTANPSGPTVPAGRDVEYTATLTNTPTRARAGAAVTAEELVSGVPVVFKTEGGTQLGSITTVNGVATLTTTPPASGTFAVTASTATYTGDAVPSNTVRLQVGAITPAPAHVVLAPLHAVVPVGEFLTLTALVLDALSRAAPGVPVAFTVLGDCGRGAYAHGDDEPTDTRWSETDGAGVATLRLRCHHQGGRLVVVASAPRSSGGGAVVSSEPSHIEFVDKLEDGGHGGDNEHERRYRGEYGGEYARRGGGSDGRAGRYGDDDDDRGGGYQGRAERVRVDGDDDDSRAAGHTEWLHAA